MLTLNALGRHGGDLVNFLRSSLKDNANELKILIDGPVQVEEIRKFLEPLGFSDFILEDDDGNLYLMTSAGASGSKGHHENSMPAESQPMPVSPIQKLPVPPTDSSGVTRNSQVKAASKNLNFNIQKSTGVLISGENKKRGRYGKIFMHKVLSSLVNSKIKPEILALIDDAVNLAAYNSPSCDYLKELETGGVKILISESCADFSGVTEALGAGTAVDMSEIFEEIFSCERIVNL